MLHKTYEKILECFNDAHGYMSFGELKEKKVTILQIRELEESGVLWKFARGWYWCRKCDFELPQDSRYVEIAKVNPEAVICMDSAAYLGGLIEDEPEVISVATSRTDRRKMQFDFPVRRYYLQDAGLEGEKETITTEFGSYQYYSQARTFCDCFRMSEDLPEDIYLEVLESYRQNKKLYDRVMEYASALRARRNIERVHEQLRNK